MENLVSIIIPVYNVEKYINKCLDSVLEQDYKHIEIVVINDGSTDRSVEIVKEYTDERIVLLNKVNGGLSSARNYGVKYCTGDYVFFLDSDDWIEKNTISLLVDKMQSGIDIVQGSIRRVMVDGYKEVLLQEEVLNKNILDEYFKKDKLNTVVWNKLYRKNIVKQIPFYEGYVNEDVIFTFEVSQTQPVVRNIKEIIYNYRIRADSIMHKKSLMDRMRVVHSLDVVIKECEKNEIKYLEMAYFDKYITLLYLYAYSVNKYLEYDNNSFKNLLNELDGAKKKIHLRTIMRCANRKQLLGLYIPSLFSKKIVAFMFKFRLKTKESESV